MAYEKGISEQELVEFLVVAMTTQGCPGEEWALKAFAAYKELSAGTRATEAASCCNHSC
jgi:alkylhydroperoxidase/carboxymuconolactone decarboxylase family protein YurZ